MADGAGCGGHAGSLLHINTAQTGWGAVHISYPGLSQELGEEGTARVRLRYDAYGVVQDGRAHRAKLGQPKA